MFSDLDQVTRCDLPSILLLKEGLVYHTWHIMSVIHLQVALVFPNNDPVMFMVAFYGCLLAELVPVPIEVPLTRKVKHSLPGICGAFLTSIEPTKSSSDPCWTFDPLTFQDLELVSVLVCVYLLFQLYFLSQHPVPHIIWFGITQSFSLAHYIHNFSFALSENGWINQKLLKLL